MESFKICGYIVEFYENPTNTKYYNFRIKYNKEATDILFSLCKIKKVKKENVLFAKNLLRRKIKANYPLIKKEEYDNTIENPIITLSKKIKKIYRKNIYTEVTGKIGPDNCPKIVVKINLPDGSFEKAIGYNQKEAKRKAAIKALQRLNLL